MSNAREKVKFFENVRVAGVEVVEKKSFANKRKDLVLITAD